MHAELKGRKLSAYVSRDGLRRLHNFFCASVLLPEADDGVGGLLGLLCLEAEIDVECQGAALVGVSRVIFPEGAGCELKGLEG